MCVEIRTCPFFDDLLNKTMIPRPKYVIKLIRENQCGLYRNTPYVCCEKVTMETTTEERKTSIEPLPLPSEANGIQTITEITSHPNYRLLPNGICGPIAIDSRITSGSKATLNEYPWMALIAYDVGKSISLN